MVNIHLKIPPKWNLNGVLSALTPTVTFMLISYKIVVFGATALFNQYGIQEVSVRENFDPECDQPPNEREIALDPAQLQNRWQLVGKQIITGRGGLTQNTQSHAPGGSSFSSGIIGHRHNPGRRYVITGYDDIFDGPYYIREIDQNGNFIYPPDPGHLIPIINIDNLWSITSRLYNLDFQPGIMEDGISSPISYYSPKINPFLYSQSIESITESNDYVLIRSSFQAFITRLNAAALPGHIFYQLEGNEYGRSLVQYFKQGQKKWCMDRNPFCGPVLDNPGDFWYDKCWYKQEVTPTPTPQPPPDHLRLSLSRSQGLRRRRRDPDEDEDEDFIPRVRRRRGGGGGGRGTGIGGIIQFDTINFNVSKFLYYGDSPIDLSFQLLVQSSAKYWYLYHYNTIREEFNYIKPIYEENDKDFTNILQYYDYNDNDYLYYCLDKYGNLWRLNNDLFLIPTDGVKEISIFNEELIYMNTLGDIEEIGTTLFKNATSYSVISPVDGYSESDDELLIIYSDGGIYLYGEENPIYYNSAASNIKSYNHNGVLYILVTYQGTDNEGSEIRYWENPDTISYPGNFQLLDIHSDPEMGDNPPREFLFSFLDFMFSVGKDGKLSTISSNFNQQFISKNVEVEMYCRSYDKNSEIISGVTMASNVNIILSLGIESESEYYILNNVTASCTNMGQKLNPDDFNSLFNLVYDKDNPLTQEECTSYFGQSICNPWPEEKFPYEISKKDALNAIYNIEEDLNVTGWNLLYNLFSVTQYSKSYENEENIYTYISGGYSSFYTNYEYSIPYMRSVRKNIQDQFPELFFPDLFLKDFINQQSSINFIGIDYLFDTIFEFIQSDPIPHNCLIYFLGKTTYFCVVKTNGFLQNNWGKPPGNNKDFKIFTYDENDDEILTYIDENDEIEFYKHIYVYCQNELHYTLPICL